MNKVNIPEQVWNDLPDGYKQEIMDGLHLGTNKLIDIRIESMLCQDNPELAKLIRWGRRHFL